MVFVAPASRRPIMHRESGGKTRRRDAGATKTRKPIRGDH